MLLRRPPRAELVEMQRRMLLIRGFEERVAALYRDGLVSGFVHLSIGQEAAAVGACWSLRPDDVITSTHRGHGHCLAKGLDPVGMFAELMGRDQGTNRGRGGSMHIADPALGIFGANGIVAAGLPIATGAAAAAQLRGADRVALAFFGDGAAAQGAFHEALNLAAVWRLPVIFFCENNGYSEFSPTSSQQAASLEHRAGGYGLPYVAVNGNDVVTAATAMRDVVEAARSGDGPAVVEANTYRWHGHYEGDPQRYRSADEVREWQERDPLTLHRRRLLESGVSGADLEALESSVSNELDTAVDRARSYASPSAATLFDFVVRRRPTIPEPSEPADDAPTYRTMDAIRSALESELAADERVFLAGVDVGAGGNVFGLTRGLRDRFGRPGPGRPDLRDRHRRSRRRGGHGGHAASGRDHVPRLHRRLLRPAAQPGGQAPVHDRRIGRDGPDRANPVRCRPLFGKPALPEPRGAPGAHPGTHRRHAVDARPTPTGCCAPPIEDPNPVVFIENRLLYGMKGPAAPGRLTSSRSAGRPSYARDRMSPSSRYHGWCTRRWRRRRSWPTEGISVEVIDLRTVAPLDMEPVLASVRKTGRLLIAHEAVVPFGIGAEIAATVARDGFWDLDAPIERVGAAATPPPYAPELERAWLPDRQEIADAIRRLAAV